MKVNIVAGLVLLMAIPGYGQTAGELLQKGIYTQETAGDLDGAISIYRQIVNSGSSPRDLAAQAQYRLAQSLLQKGDLGNAASEFEKLARSYADYSKLVSSLAAQAQAVTVGARVANSITDKLTADLSREVAAALDQRKTQALAQGAAAGTIRIGGGAAAANLIQQVKPAYPADLKAQGVEGTVVVQATISKEGVPIDLQAILQDNTGLNPELVKAAMSAIWQWRYKPTLLNGQPVQVQTTITVNFTLSK